MDNNEKSKNDTSNYTRQQTAKKAGVGTGTVAGFNRVKKFLIQIMKNLDKKSPVYKFWNFLNPDKT